MDMYTGELNQTAVTKYFESELLLLFDFAGLYITIPANTNHLYNICTTSAQRLRRWSNIVQML